VIVVDASAAMAGLFNDGPARQALGAEHLHAPHLVDSEVASGLRRRVAAGQLSAANRLATLHAWRRLAVTRYAIHGLLDRVWELRHSLTVSMPRIAASRVPGWSKSPVAISTVLPTSRGARDGSRTRARVGWFCAASSRTASEPTFAGCAGDQNHGDPHFEWTQRSRRVRDE
jgi:hypothetical protein